MTRIKCEWDQCTHNGEFCKKREITLSSHNPKEKDIPSEILICQDFEKPKKIIKKNLVLR